ncbi:MAG: replicative DNA helicase [Pseudomonadota bacterium]
MAVSVDSIRVPPHSVEAEQSVLGGLMLTADAWDQVADLVTEDDFYRRDHRLLFRALASLRQADQPCDAVTLGEWLESNELTDQVGGVGYVISLANNTPSAANIKAYAGIVREKSILRQLIDVSNEIAGDAFHPEGRSSGELLESAEKKVFDIRDKGARQQAGFAHVREGVKAAFHQIEFLTELDGNITGVPTGFNDFDEKTAGLQRSDLIIVAGRPAMGKTSFALNIAEHAAISAGCTVAVFSMEMSAQQLVMRLLSSLGRINQQRLRTGNLHDDDWPRLTSAMNMLVKTNIFIDETPALSPTELRARARRLKREHDLGLIVIDYLQLMQVPGSSENRATEIAEISRSLKALAKELDVPVIALSQLNRALEQRPNKRPVMADLRESGSIEQDADVIAFIYRDEVYNEDSPDKGKAEIIIGKQRNGSTGMVPLTFLGQYTRFENFAADHLRMG